MHQRAEQAQDDKSRFLFARLIEAVQWIADDPNLDAEIKSYIDDSVANTETLSKIAHSAEYN